MTTSPPPAPVAGHTTEFVDWLETDGCVDFPEVALTRLEQESARAASELITDHQATVDVSPGNGYRYVTVLTLLPADTRLPGRLLVSCPELHVCTLLDPIGYHTPTYLTDKIGTKVAGQHAGVLAVLTTLVSNHLTGLL